MPDASTAWPEDDGEAMQIFLDEQIAVLPRLLDAVADADAVLYDIGGFAGRAAAHRWGVPAVQLSPTYVAWEGYEEDMAEYTAAFITHAGMGSTAESLWFGVRTVAIPQAVDQFTNAAQLEAIGAGVQLRAEHVDAERVRAAALSRTERARALSVEVRQAGGVGIAADAVQRLLARPRMAA